MLLPYFKRLSLYNQWANGRLYAACADLTDAERKAPRKAFFGSIHRTLNHLVLTDRMWFSRIVPGSTPLVAPLDTQLYEDFAELRREREKRDKVIIDFVAGLSDTAIAEVQHYANASGQPQQTVLGTILQHFFNHQTHHRGQVHGMLSQTTVAPPPLDLIYFVRQVPEAA